MGREAIQTGPFFRMGAGLRPRGTDGRERGGLVPLGQPTVGADFLEAFGQDVQQEAPDEVHAGDRRRLLAVAVRAVTPGEGDVAVFDGEDAVVGDRDAVGVASEVVQNWKYGTGSTSARRCSNQRCLRSVWQVGQCRSRQEL